jgi:glycosyltransferase involved in cell wall biosynthesis
MSRALLICPEPIRRLTAGVGTRFLMLSRLLVEAGHQVTLALANDPTEAEGVAAGVDLIAAEPDRLGEQARGHDWVLLQGHLGNHYLAQRDDLPVVVDLYDPFLVENLHYHREIGLQPYLTDHATWRLQLSRGDLFLCSSAEQRLYYLGILTALGRINPLTTESDSTLSRLIVELPFGVPEGEPPVRRPRSQLLPGVDDDAPVLYFGGIYDWYDPLLLLDALPELLAADPRTTVLFVEHPHPDLMPLSAAYQTRSTAEQRGWLGHQVQMVPWQPYEQRFDLPLTADLAVVTHRPGLETDLSLRTRLVDLLWLGLPVVVTAGGTMARVVHETGAGRVVPADDAGALARAVRELLDDSQQRLKAARAGRSWAATRTWRALAQPLLSFAERPWYDRHKHRFAAAAPGEVAAVEPLSRRLARRLRRLGVRF